VQSEPWWWRYEPDEAEFEFAFQIDTEDKALDVGRQWTALFRA
jgi:hypothetical protein